MRRVRPAQLDHPSPKNDEYSDVEEEGDDKRDVKGSAGGIDHVAGRLEEDAIADVGRRVLYVVLGQVVPPEQRWNAYDGGDDPNESGVDGRLTGRSFLAIPDRIECCREAIEGDDAQVPDGSGAVEYVHDQPDVAQDPAKDPVPQALVKRGQWQDGDGQEEVAQSQVADQVVGNRLKIAVAEERHPDQEVAERGGNDDDEEERGDDDHDGEGVVDGELRLPFDVRKIRVVGKLFDFRQFVSNSTPIV